jgi:hypothetical protein
MLANRGRAALSWLLEREQVESPARALPSPAPMTDDLRYSDRRRFAELGSLPVHHDKPPRGFLNALSQLISELHGRSPAGAYAWNAVNNHWRQHFGISSGGTFPGGSWLSVQARTTDDVLDLVEILVEEAAYRTYSFHSGSSAAGWPDIENRLNRLFARHRFGFRVSGGAVRQIGSPALDEQVVAPALMAVHRPGWEQAERSFREALAHQRGGEDERDDALTAATAALEAALKAAGLSGTHLSQLAKSLRNSDLVPGQLKGVPDSLDTLLKRSGAIRDPLSDAHGKAPGADEVPQELVDLSIYWTGAFINYLAEATNRHSPPPSLST